MPSRPQLTTSSPCRLASRIGTAPLIVPLLFLVLVSSSNPASGAPSPSRRMLLQSSDNVITYGDQDDNDVGPNFSAKGIAHPDAYSSSMRAGSDDRFITAATRSLLPPLAHQTQEKQAENGRASSLISPNTAEGYDSSLDDDSNDDDEVLLREVDALVADMVMYDTAEYENEMQLNLDIDLPLLLVLGDRDATAEVMEMIEVRATNCVLSMHIITETEASR